MNSLHTDVLNIAQTSSNTTPPNTPLLLFKTVVNLQKKNQIEN